MSRRVLAIGLVASATALVTAAAAVATGPGMIGGAFGGSGGGGAGSKGAAEPTKGQLTGVRNEVDNWLGSNGFKGFKVAEIMAFTNNDYVAVHDTKGMPAFELLTDLNVNWLMEEPPSMMWNTKYGAMGDSGNQVSPMMGTSMMGGSWNGWYGAPTGKVPAIGKAVAVANRYLAKADPGEKVASDAGGSGMGKFPGYYSFDTTKNGKTYGMLSVNASTGAVWYHRWHGTFLAEVDF